VKLLLSVLLWMNELWAYPVAIAMFSLFGILGVYRFTHTHSALLIVIAVFDLLIVWLAWEEYAVEKKKRAEQRK
jgi:uncharacterized membrane protein